MTSLLPHSILVPSGAKNSAHTFRYATILNVHPRTPTFNSECTDSVEMAVIMRARKGGEYRKSVAKGGEQAVKLEKSERSTRKPPRPELEESCAALSMYSAPITAWQHSQDRSMPWSCDPDVYIFWCMPQFKLQSLFCQPWSFFLFFLAFSYSIPQDCF